MKVLNDNHSVQLASSSLERGNGNAITLEDIDKEIQYTLEQFEPIPHNQILEKLLESVEHIDFRDRLDIKDPDDKPTRRQLIILSVEEILRLARQNNWGLCRKHDFVYLYNGAFWKRLEDEALKNFLGKGAEKMGVYKYDARYYLFRDQLLKQFFSSAFLPEPVQDRSKVLINLKNGTFEITRNGGELRPFDRQDFLIYQLPFAHAPSAKAPLFKKYLDRVLPDQGLQFILAEFLAYVFARHLKLEKTLLLYGTGANGKSVFFEIVNALLGKENVSSYSLQSLTNESGYHRSRLGDFLLNYASEINGKLGTGLFKQLVSGEPIEARLPYGQPFILSDYARLLFNCNELPHDVEHTNAYFRRFVIIPFSVTIPKEEQDPELPNKIIKDELSGVFNWVLDGLKRLLEQRKFTHSDQVENELMNFRLQSDSVLLFLDEEGYTPSVESYKALKEVYRDYKTFCYENEMRPVSNRTIKKRLENLGYSTIRKSQGHVVFLEKK
jgi:putative DNA primase/helicase